MKTVIQFPAAAILIAAASVRAQDSTTTATCAAQNILDACLETTEGYLSLCTSTDYTCLCNQYIAIMTCFNNCPNDSRQPSYQQQKDLYCMNASLYATTTPTATQTGSQTVDATTTDAAATTTSSEGAIKSTDMPASNTAMQNSNDGAPGPGPAGLFAGRGGLIAAVAGAVAAFL
ncbi:hypothetical protein AAE478_006728 [Parahypoxylon ruwenzoriense]